MKSPKWAYFVGIMMILVGSCSVNKHVQALKVPKFIDLKNELLNDVSFEVNTYHTDSLDLSDATYEEIQDMEELMEMISNFGANAEEALRISAHAETWLVRLGYAGIAFAVIYILGGLMLLIPKPTSIQVAYIGLGLGLLFNIIHWIIMAMDPEISLISQSSAYLNAVGIVIDLLLFAVIYLADKSAFFENQTS